MEAPRSLQHCSHAGGDRMNGVHVLFAVLLLSSGALRAQSVTTSGELAASCLVTCQALNGRPTLMEELGKNDRCVGYLKGLAGGVEWFNESGNSKIDVGSCPKKLLSDRTATRPQDDEVLVQSCSFAKWVSARPTVHGRPASQVALNWMKVTHCD